jgi:heme exporter protein CcmD
MQWSADYVGYVLTAYAITAVILAAVVLRTLWRSKSLKAKLSALNLPDAGNRDT